MIAYKIVVFLILLLVLILLSIIVFQSFIGCSSKSNNNKHNLLYLDSPKYDIITTETKPKNGGLVWDDGNPLNPVIVPVYNSEDYYKDYYDGYYKGVIDNNSQINYQRENFENEAIQNNKLTEIIENNKNDILLKLASQAYQDQQINHLEHEISQLTDKF